MPARLKAKRELKRIGNKRLRSALNTCETPPMHIGSGAVRMKWGHPSKSGFDAKDAKLENEANLYESDFWDYFWDEDYWYDVLDCHNENHEYDWEKYAQCS